MTTLRENLRVPEATRFWAKVDKTDTCWLWTAAKTSHGYGTFGSSTSGPSQRTVYAHRWAYEAIAGPIPDGLVLDHLCRVRHCVNPAHLEPVTQRENFDRGLRSTRNPTCIHGHPKTPENTYVYKGLHGCRTCRRDQRRACDERKRAAS